MISIAVNVGRFLEFQLIHMDSVGTSSGIMINETLNDNETKYVTSLLKNRNDTNNAMDGIPFDYGHYASRSSFNSSHEQRQEGQM